MLTITKSSSILITNVKIQEEKKYFVTNPYAINPYHFTLNSLETTITISIVDF